MCHLITLQKMINTISSLLIDQLVEWESIHSSILSQLKTLHQVLLYLLPLWAIFISRTDILRQLYLPFATLLPSHLLLYYVANLIRNVLKWHLALVEVNSLLLCLCLHLEQLLFLWLWTRAQFHKHPERHLRVIRRKTRPNSTILHHDLKIPVLVPLQLIQRKPVIQMIHGSAPHDIRPLPRMIDYIVNLMKEDGLGGAQGEVVPVDLYIRHRYQHRPITIHLLLCRACHYPTLSNY